MNLTTALEKEILATYKGMWEAYFRGDAPAYTSLFDEDITIIGSSEAEYLQGKKEATAFYTKVADEPVGKAEFRNRNISIKPIGDQILVLETPEVFILLDGKWTFYAKLRLSSVLTLRNGEWKFVLQHGSVPDDKTQGEETIGFDAISRENNELRNAVKRQTREIELKNRELEIEVALERVRARTMAMQHSDELPEAANVLFLEVQGLGIPAWSAGYNILSDDKKSSHCIMSSEGEIQTPFILPLTEHVSLLPWHEAIVQDLPFFVYQQGGKDLEEHYEYMATVPGLTEVFQQFADAGISLPTFQVNHLCSFTNGFLLFITYEQVPDAHDIFKRFTGVFEQTYTRFLDLKLAEKQSRDSQIELSLERVRSRAMAMHSSEELLDAGAILYQELTKLGIESVSSGYVLVDIENNTDWNYMTNPSDGSILPEPIGIPNNQTDNMRAIHKSWKAKEPYHLIELDPEETIAHQTFIAEKSNHFPITAEELISFSPERLKLNCFNFKQGYLLIVGIHKLADEQIDMMLRFTKVFGLAYRRFLDLKQAEAQAREAQIETALEKVRSRTMAMHNSDELSDTAFLLFQQMMSLGVKPERFIIGIINDDESAISFWVTEQGGKQLKTEFIGRLDEPTFISKFYAAWKAKAKSFSIALTGEELESWLSYLKDELKLPVDEKLVRDKRCHSLGFFSKGALGITSPEPLPTEHIELLEKFALVFDQTYTRFLDLQKAEAQAREAKIENALEKVRSRTMAMQHSDELTETSFLLDQEVRALGIQTWGCAFNIYREEDSIEWFGNEAGVLPTYIVPRVGIFKEYYDLGQQGESFYVKEFAGEDCISHYEYMSTLPILGEVLLDLKESNGAFPDYQIDHVAYFKYGYLLFITIEHVPAAYDVFKRFANVFEQSYTRFLDLQKAEAQTKKANIEVALERVRARALAMHTPEELIEVAEVMRHEMGLLGIEELETASIYINDPNSNKSECWYALKDVRQSESKLVSDHFALDFTDTWVGREMLKFYDTEDIRTDINMRGKNRIEWIRYCEEMSPALKGYYGEEVPDRTYHLYKFSHGAVGAASPGEISEESWGLLKRAASVFSLAYSRFKDLTQARLDLQQLKAEKQRAEEALMDLKAAQSQLVQAEKMASLGELTAGIAHEIQNPLNFVNNFSEVSAEMIDEMKEELADDHKEDAIDIANDIKQNIEKILHHGKRADAIVKGMLQHSRTGSGVSEPTDINSLCDEYLRLAYHGLRAKDKSFNAKMETHFDESIEPIKIVQQDIGRVILNLITNAFWAVNEKAQSSVNGYDPKVEVSTFQKGSHVEIIVSDNGPGIPDSIKDKIFQPFFTTKPTGQGTGLGLSLAYDIIKSHDGDLIVETTKGEGTSFKIKLPVNP